MEANSYPTLKPVSQATDGVESVETLVTHSGPFHFDDVLSAALIKMLWPKAVITRTRDQFTLVEGKENPRAVVFDVGGEFDSSLRVFDHHFVGAPRRDDDTPYASAGLVWTHLVGELFQRIASAEQIAVLEDVIRAADSTDNGVKIGPEWTLSLSIHKANPIAASVTPDQFDQRFAGVVLIVQKAIEHLLLDGISSVNQFQKLVEGHPMMVKWVSEHDAELTASAERVREAFNRQEDELIVLERYEPALMEVAYEAPLHKLFSVFPSPSGEWMVQQIPAWKASFTGRKKLPASWAGKRGEDLDKLTLLEGSVFCHPGRFIAGHKTREGAIAMARLAAFVDEDS